MDRDGEAQQSQTRIGDAIRMSPLILALLLGLACILGPASAQPYPGRPIKLVVPFPPGGPVDVMGRLVAQELSHRLGTVIVDNRPGAGGTIGSRSAAAAPPDGYTLLFGSSTTLAASPALYKNLGYDPVRSFAPVAMISSVPFALVVAPALPVHTVAELVANAKAHPGKLNYGAPTGALPHLTAEMFKTAASVDIVHIPYKGAANGITDLLSGQVDLTFEPISVLVGHIRDGTLRALAVTGETRSAELPDLPTMIESGLPSVVSVSVERDRRTRRHGGADRRADQCGGECRPRHARHAIGPGAPWRRTAPRHAGGFRRLHRRRDAEMGRRGEGGTYYGGVG